MQRVIESGARMIWIRRDYGGTKREPRMIPVTVIKVMKSAKVRVEETGSIRNVDPDNLRENGHEGI